MKKICLLLSAMVIGLFAFTSCDDENDGGSSAVVYDGIYVIGDATGSTEFDSDYRMGAGTNEADDNAARAGMYEKYVALEANKDFSLALYTAGEITYYGASLTADSLDGDNEPSIVAFKGSLVIGESAPMMSVATSGLYHIVLDLNLSDDLSSAMIVVAPVEWGVHGAMNGWGFTALDAPAFNQETMTYTWSDTVFNGGQFKFAYGNGWKIELDQAGLVKANTNLGNDATEDGADFVGPLQGGKNFAIAKGVYDITLVWTLKGGSIANSYSISINQTATLPNTDWSAVKFDAVGSGVSADNTASVADAYWTWGQMLFADGDGLPTKNGEVYTYTWSNVVLEADGFKIRQLNATYDGVESDQGYGIVDATNSSTNIVDDGGDIKNTVKGTYNMTLVIDAANGDAKTLTIVAAN